MAYRSFRVGPSKGLQAAELSAVPDVVVVVGPNGAGKSTLLYELWRQRQSIAESGTRVTYISPNRAWRRTTLTGPSMFGLQMSFRQILEQESIPGFQYQAPPGYFQSGGARQADSMDEAQSLVKYAIAKIEVRRQRLISAVFDRSGGRIEPDSVPDVYAPLRELVRSLLPHLEFLRVDVSNENDQRCIFAKLDSVPAVELDIDDLSSGEKAAIALFLPFVESQISILLEGVQATSNDVRPVALIDEPELHLHPALQVALMAYIRQLAQQRTAQFIMATHSTTIMDELEDDELYLLAPPSTVGGGNQLSKVSATTERLEIVRELTGSTYVVTRCRPIVFLEGERPGGRVVSDQRVVEMLVPEARGWVIVPAHGRSQVVRLASELRQPYLTELPGMSVFALVDQDQGADNQPEFVITWPVCMLENLLLDPTAIWALLEPQREAVGITSAAEVRTILRRYCHERKDDEVRLRVRRQIGQPLLALTLERKGDAGTLPERARVAGEAHVQRTGGEGSLTAAIELARAEVDAIINAGQQLERFHGKELLKRFFDEYAKRAGWNYATFCYQLAEKVKPTARVRSLVDAPVRRIRQFVPARLQATAAACADFLRDAAEYPTALAASNEVTRARAAWEQGIEDSIDRARLRQRLLDVGRSVRDAGNSQLYQQLLADLVELGAG